MSTRVWAFVVLAAAFAARGPEAHGRPVQFLATDGNKLFRADSDGNVQPFVLLSDPIQSLTFVPPGMAIPGASGGQIIAAARDPVAGVYPVYRLDDPFGATPTLTQIGGTTMGVGSFAFANGDLYGVHSSLSPIRVHRFDTTTWASLQNWSTGISTAGGGGLAYDVSGSRFLVTDSGTNRLMAWNPGGSATLIGPTGQSFLNNGIEFLSGTLYGALRPDSPNNVLRMGAFDLSTGAFTTLATATGIVGGGTGFVAIPAPGALALLGAGALWTARRRRT